MIRLSCFKINEFVAEGEDQRASKAEKRQQVLEEKPYPDELYGFEAESYEFFMLVDGSLDYVLANKRVPRHQRRSLEKSFLSFILTYFRV